MLISLLDRHAVERPGMPALVAGGRATTWEELQEQVRRLAIGLSARGVSKGDRVAILLPNCPAFVIGLLAVARLGSVAIPLNTDSKPEQIRGVLDTASCETLLADDTFTTLCQELLRDGSIRRAFLRQREEPGLPSLQRLAADSAGHLETSGPFEHDDLLEQFTSGTTGQPTRVIRTHAALCRMTAAFGAAAQISAVDRILAVVPFCHGHGLNNALLTALRTGATLVLQEKFDRRETLQLLGREQITIFPVVPFLAGILADTRSRESVNLSALRLCVTAGSALSRETWVRARDRLGISLRQCYGGTETGVVTLDVDRDPSPESVGRPLDGVEISVLSDTGSALPCGAEGDLAIRSPWAASWRVTTVGRQPIADASGWIRMKDVGRLDLHGRLHVTGNSGILINVAGRKVNPVDVELALMSHPKVRDAVVVSMRDSYGEQAVRAEVVASEACTMDELLAYCRERLADYQVPRVLQFRSAVARTPAGKVLRHTLG